MHWAKRLQASQYSAMSLSWTSARRALRLCGFVSTADGAPPYKVLMRRFVFSVLLLFAMAASAYVGYWFYVADRIRTGIEPWAEARRAEGYIAHWDSAAVDGFPASFRLTFTRAVFSGIKPLAFEIAGPTLVGEARPWDLKRWHISAPQGAGLEAPIENGAIEAASLDGTLDLDTPNGTAIALVAHDIAGGGAVAGLRIADADVRLTLPDHSPAGHMDAAFATTLHLSKLTLPISVPSFGSTVEALTLSGSFKGALPPGNLRQALAAWRDDGGTIELQDGSIRWGALVLDTKGTLALDDTLQPIGALTATIQGQNAIVDAAVAAGNLRAGDASLLKTFLGLMAKPGPDGTKLLTLPVSLQNTRVYLGPAQIADLPHITWE